MAPFHKILVPIDFSRHAERALVVACELGKQFQIPITLFHAYAIPTYPLPEGFVIPSPETVAELLEKSQSAMNAAQVKATGLGAPKVETKMTEGVAFTEIIRVAREDGFDLIVMGTHGRTGLKHALLGSVAEKVVRKASCAVLTVRDPEHAFERP